MLQLRGFFHNGRAMRLLIAFLIGIPLGLLADKLGSNLANILPYLFFPLVLGILGALTIGARTRHPHLLALGTGLLSWGGVGAALLVLTTQAALTTCASGTCGSTTTSMLGAWLIFYLILGLLLVAFSATIASLLWQRWRRQA